MATCLRLTPHLVSALHADGARQNPALEEIGRGSEANNGGSGRLHIPYILLFYMYLIFVTHFYCTYNAWGGGIVEKRPFRHDRALESFSGSLWDFEGHYAQAQPQNWPRCRGLGAFKRWLHLS